MTWPPLPRFARPPEGAALAVRQSRPGGALGLASSLFDVLVFLLSPQMGHSSKDADGAGDSP